MSAEHRPGAKHPCDYCGTMLDEDDCVESDIPAVNGRTLHSASQCREYVYAALQSYKREVAATRAALSQLDEVKALLAATTEHVISYDAALAAVAEAEQRGRRAGLEEAAKACESASLGYLNVHVDEMPRRIRALLDGPGRETETDRTAK